MELLKMVRTIGCRLSAPKRASSLNRDVGSKKMKHYIATAMLFIFSSGLCLGAGPRFGLYFITNNTIQLERTELASQPLFTETDIVAYHWTNHTFVLTEEAAQRIPPISDVGTGGKWFVIMADGQRCYLGAFWTSFSSIGSTHPVIRMPIGETTTSFRIDAGYPTGIMAEGDLDQRNNEAIKKVLFETGKIKE